jgi:hypothetical protein
VTARGLGQRGLRNLRLPWQAWRSHEARQREGDEYHSAISDDFNSAREKA